MPDPIKIVVSISGGVLTEVASNLHGVQVALVDYDDRKDQEEPEELDENDNPPGFEDCLFVIY